MPRTVASRGSSALGVLSAHPQALALLGALTIAWSAILVKLADVSPATAAVFRCAYALPVLGLLAWVEDRRLGARPWRGRALALVSGLFFAVDLICWHYAIEGVGAGLATVLANLQVIVVPALAWLVLGERVSARVLATLPLLIAGIVLISGALGHQAYGEHPVAGVAFGLSTGVSYGIFLLLLRSGGADLRRPAGPLLDATASATVFAIVIGLAIGDVDLVPSWPSVGWLVALALSSQVVGWLLISSSLPRLPAALTSVILTVQPLGSIVLAVVLFGESPSALQFVGVAVLLAGLALVVRVRQPQ